MYSLQIYTKINKHMSPIPLKTKIANFISVISSLIIAYFLSKNWLTFIIISFFVYIVIIIVYTNYQDGLASKNEKNQT